MTTPAPCRDCQRLTWCMRGICPWCEGKRKALADAEEAARLAMNPVPVFKTKPAYRMTDTEGEYKRPDQVRAKQSRISSEGMGVGLAD